MLSSPSAGPSLGGDRSEHPATLFRHTQDRDRRRRQFLGARLHHEEPAAVPRHVVVAGANATPSVLTFKEHLRFPGTEAAPRLDRDGDQALAASIEQLPPIAPPDGLGPAIRCDLKTRSGAWKRLHVELTAARFLRRVHQPSPIGRLRRIRFGRRTVDQRPSAAFACKTEKADIALIRGRGLRILGSLGPR